MTNPTRPGIKGSGLESLGVWNLPCVEENTCQTSNFPLYFSTCIEPMGLSRPAEFHLLDWISDFLPNNCLRLYSTVQKVSKDSVVSMAWIILILVSNYVVVCSQSMNLCISNSPIGSMYGIFT